MGTLLENYGFVLSQRDSLLDTKLLKIIKRLFCLLNISCIIGTSKFTSSIYWAVLPKGTQSWNWYNMELE